MDFITSLAIESWTLYSVGMILVLCRLVARRLKLGTWRLQIDDWLMVFATANFTSVMVSVNSVAVNGSSYMDPAVAATLTPEENAAAVLGSKMTLVLEMSTLTCIWTVKACLLILYYRLTKGLYKQQRFVLFIAGYSVVAYSLVIGLLLGWWCHPIWQYWAVPYQISQCATYYNHMIFATAWNISSDLMLLAVPFPIIFKTQFSLKRKIILCCVLCLGVLNIVIAILNRYYNFSNPDDLGYVYFYVAEVATAIYVGNIPLTWPLVQRFVKGSSWTSQDSDADYTSGKKRGLGGSAELRTIGGSGPSGTGPRSRNRGPRGSPWGKLDDDLEDNAGGSTGPGSREDIVCGAEEADNTSVMELTPRWHHEANVSGVHASPRADSSDGESTGRPARAGGNGGSRDSHYGEKKTGIVKTVEISTGSHAR